MNILIINSGSSSIKFQLVQMPVEIVLSSGIVERIGGADARIKFVSETERLEKEMSILTHEDGLRIITDFLTRDTSVGSNSLIDAVGHRVVHGGNIFSDTCEIDDEVIDKIEQYSTMAPLHNPHNLKGIQITKKLLPNARQVAVFDTAFHQTVPEVAHRYAIPKNFYAEHEIKAYGFHGTSHSYVVKEAIKFLPDHSGRIISIHLGNGCSITAVRNGKSVDTSLGFGPSNGLIMGTRSGDIDHSLIFYLRNALGYKTDDIKSVLDKQSGMLGLTGFSDLRDIEAAAIDGNKDCMMALQMNAYRIKKYIGAYSAAMNGVDCILFTAGIGENSTTIRKMVCDNMDFMGIVLDPVKNDEKSNEIRAIEAKDSKVKILVIPTNEELEIARQTFDLSS